MNDHINNPVWGQNLRKMVAETGLSQAAFARQHNFTSRTFNSWCNGRWPGEKTAREVASALGVDYASLISEKPFGLNSDDLMIAIQTVDDRLADYGAIPQAARAKLYQIAYEHLQMYKSPQALVKHVTDLLTLQKQMRL